LERNGEEKEERMKSDSGGGWRRIEMN